MGTLFQSEAFYSFLNDTGFLTPFVFSVQRDVQEVGKIQGYIQSDGKIIKRFFSKRAIVNAGPSFFDGIQDDEIESLLNKCICGLRGRAIYIEIRNFQDYSAFRPIFEKVGFSYEPHYDFRVNTVDPVVVEERMGKSRKRDVKTSLKSGVSVDLYPSREDVVSFYKVLSHLYETRVKTPLFPLSFFEKLYDAPFSKFILVRFEGEVVGGTVCVFDDDTVYEWFACGKDGVYKNVYPSTVATYYGIRFAAENGYRCFDMMGAGAPGDGGYGVRDFKAKFGGELVEYGRFRYVANKPLFALGKLAVRLMKKK